MANLQVEQINSKTQIQGRVSNPFGSDNIEFLGNYRKETILMNKLLKNSNTKISKEQKLAILQQELVLAAAKPLNSLI